MKLTLLQGQCNNGRSCPNVNLSDRGTLVVQGYILPQEQAAELGVLCGETVVEIPMGLLRAELVGEGVRTVRTEHETQLVIGRRVTDPEALAELNLPDGEDAVEIAAAREAAAHA